MILQLHKAKKVIWVVLLLSFCIVYVTAFLCDFGNYNIYKSTTHHKESSINNHSNSHNHQLNHEHNRQSY